MNDNSPSVQINVFQGIDRVSSEQMLESTPERILYFPVVATPLIFSLNFIDDNVLGGNGKRPGFVLAVAAPEANPNYLQYQYTYNNVEQNFAQIGSHLYMWNNTGSWAWTSTYTLSGQNPGIFKQFGGFLFYTNGIDPFLMWDGTYWYQLVNNIVSGITITDLTINSTTLAINPVSYNINGANFPENGFISVTTSGVTEIIQYLGLNKDGLNRVVGFAELIRGYADTIPVTAVAGSTVNVWYGTPPTSPKYLGNVQTRLFAANYGGNPNNITWTASPREVTDPYNWIEDQTTSATQLVYSSFDNNSLSGGAGAITALDDSGQNMLVYKGTQTYLMTVDSTNHPTQFVLIDGSTGTFSQNSITNIQNTQFSFGYNGVQAYGGSGLVLLSKPIDDLTKGVPLNNLTSITANAYDYKLFVFVPQTTEADRFGGKTYTNVTFVYNYLTSNWFIWQTPFVISSFKNMVDANGVLQMYVGDNVGNTYVFNPNKNSPIYTDNGKAISVMLQTKYIYFNRQNFRKQFGDITVNVERSDNGTVAFSLLSDKEKGDYVGHMKIPNYSNRVNTPDMSSYYYAMSYQITESSTAPFFLYSITQELEYKKGY